MFDRVLNTRLGSINLTASNVQSRIQDSDNILTLREKNFLPKFYQYLEFDEK